MLHPSQFLINEAWIAFRVKEAPIRTLRDGDFNCIALMDAASCYIIGTVMVPVELAEPSVADVRALFEKGWAADRRYPETLYLPAGSFPRIFPGEARQLGIAIVIVDEGGLLAFIGEARQGFNEFLNRGGGRQ